MATTFVSPPTSLPTRQLGALTVPGPGLHGHERQAQPRACGDDALPCHGYRCGDGSAPRVIPGTRRVAGLDDNVGAVDVALSVRDLARIEAAFPKDKVAGTRYPPAMMAAVNA